MIRLRVLLCVAAFVLGGTTICIAGYRNATATPIIRSLSVRIADYPSSAPPTRVLFFSDVHAHGPDMPPERIGRIVEQINGLHPDLVIAGGDFVGDNWIGEQIPIDRAIAPLARLKARLGVYAVLGNNDYDAGANEVARALTSAGIHVLDNQAVRTGPVALGGIDGKIRIRRSYWKERRDRTTGALQNIPGVKILAAHRPDEFKWTPAWITLVLAGHLSLSPVRRRWRRCDHGVAGPSATRARTGSFRGPVVPVCRRCGSFVDRSRTARFVDAPLLSSCN